MMPILCYGQDFKEIMSFHENGNPRFIVYKNQDLKIIRKEIFDENKNILSRFSFDPETGKTNGPFFEILTVGYLVIENIGTFSQGLLNCDNFCRVFGNSHMVIGEYSSGVSVGEHYVYKFKRVFSKAEFDQHGYDLRQDGIHVYGKENYVKNPSSIYVYEDRSIILNFNSNGLLSGDLDIPPNKYLSYENGDLTGFYFLNKENLQTVSDSVFPKSKIIIKNRKYLKNNYPSVYVQYDPFNRPFNFYMVSEEEYIEGSKWGKHEYEGEKIFDRKKLFNADTIESLHKIKTFQYQYQNHYVDYNKKNNLLNGYGIFEHNNYSIWDSLMPLVNYKDRFGNELNEDDKEDNIEITYKLKYAVTNYLNSLSSNSQITVYDIPNWAKINYYELSEAFSVNWVDYEDFFNLIFNNNTTIKDIYIHGKIDEQNFIFSLKKLVNRSFEERKRKEEEERKRKEEEERKRKEELDKQIKLSKLRAKIDSQYLIKRVNECYNYTSIINKISKKSMVFTPLEFDGRSLILNQRYYSDKIVKKSKTYEVAYKKKSFGIDIQGSHISSKDSLKFINHLKNYNYDESIDAKDYIYIVKNPYLDLPKSYSKFKFSSLASVTSQELSFGILPDNSVIIPYAILQKHKQDLIFGLKGKLFNYRSYFYVIHSPTDNKNIGILNPSKESLTNLLKNGLRAVNENGFKLGTKLKDPKKGWGFIID